MEKMEINRINDHASQCHETSSMFSLTNLKCKTNPHIYFFFLLGKYPEKQNKFWDKLNQKRKRKTSNLFNADKTNESSDEF